MRQAVAISTTGEKHRIGFLETCVARWDAALGDGDGLFVTVDGDADDVARARNAVAEFTGSVFWVGGPRWSTRPYNGRMGVAVSKNTGLELMMDNTDAEHLFLCDDDTWPQPVVGKHALLKHTTPSDVLPHSMVCWGWQRLSEVSPGRYASWTWPRGVMLYQTRAVVAQVGGMVEAFGPGGHEHAEYSRRIYQHGLSPVMFPSPVLYAEDSVEGKAHRASALWHCEDMRRPTETSVQLGHRRKTITTVKTGNRNWVHIQSVMESMDGKTDFVPYRASENGRASATLCLTSTGQGAGGEL